MANGKKDKGCRNASLKTGSGSQVARIVFGTWALGGWYWGDANDNDSIHTIHTALDHGINAFDTAPVYGFGHSEEILGRALANKREDVWISTKVGLRWDQDGELPFFETMYDYRKRRVFRNLHKKSILEECERSLRRLRTDYIDCLILHWPDPATPVAETMEACQQLAAAGKIRFLGMSNFTVAEILKIRSLAGDLPVCFDQERFNLLDRRALKGNIPYDRKNDINFMAYSPLAQGLLSGRIDTKRQFRDGDLRKNSSLMSHERRKEVGERMELLTELLVKKDVSMATIANAWVLHTPGVTLSVTGIRDEHQCRQALKAEGLRLTDEEYRTVGQIFEDIQFHGH